MMTGWRRGHFSLCLLMLCSFLHAEQLTVRVFTTEDGLSRNWINQIRRDSKGYLWFCTRGGLSRFDGHQFTNYAVADGLPHPSVLDLLETHRNEYWIATAGGLCRLRYLSPRPGRSTRAQFDTLRLGPTEDANVVEALLEDRQVPSGAGRRQASIASGRTNRTSCPNRFRWIRPLPTRLWTWPRTRKDACGSQPSAGCFGACLPAQCNRLSD